MADLNSMIARGYQFQPEPDPFVQYGQMQQLEQNRQTNALNQMKMQEMQRGVEEQNQLRRLDPAAADYLQQVSRINPKTGFEFGKLRQEAKTAELTEQKTRGEVQAQQAKAIGSALTMAMSNPTDAGLNQAFSILENQKIDTTGLRSQFANITDPTERLKAIQSYATAHPEGIAAMKFVAPDPMQVTKADGSIIFIDKNSHSPTFQKQILPPQAAGMTQTQAATVETGRGQLKVSQDRLAFEREKLKYEQNNPGFKLLEGSKPDGTTAYFSVNNVTGVAKPIIIEGTNLVNLPAQTAANRLAFDERKLKYEQDNPGFTVQDTSNGLVAVNNKDPSDVRPLMQGDKGIVSATTDTATKNRVSQELRAAAQLLSTARTAGNRLAFDQTKFAWEKANPGFTVRETDTGLVAVNSKNPTDVRPISVEGTQLKGKPSAFAEKAAAQKVQMGKDLTQAITELTDATKDGGLIDQSTGSGAGRLVDLAAGFGGKAMPGAIAIGKLQPIADIALKMIPRFEGPQSDKDTTSYKQAAGQLADPSMPTKIRKEAGKTVLRLMKARKEQFGTVDMVAEGVAPAAPGTPAPAAVAPADKQALDWANANPNDPRSLQIKQRLGQ